MKKLAQTFLLLLLPFCCVAGISPASRHLETLRVEVEAAPTRANELAYLAAFPESYATFCRMFYGQSLDELYSRHEEHLELLAKLGLKYPDRVLQRQLNIAVNGHWDADAVGMLQAQLATTAATSTERFARALGKRPKTQQKSIIAFLADVENHGAYSEYRDAIQALRALGHASLASDFEAARAKREKANGH